jgi:putative transposase
MQLVFREFGLKEASKAMISSPLDVSEREWTEAVRRSERVRTLATADKNSGDAVKAAATELGLSTAQIYRLIRKFRGSPVTQSLVVNRPGPQKGARRLPAEVEQKIEAAIDSVYKRRERPTVKKLRLEISRDCNAAGLRPPSRTAIQARISARSLREMYSAREGSTATRQRFTIVRPGLRPTSPLAIVQMDHTQVDIQLVDELSRAVIGRPWLTLLLDVFSRSVAGFYLSFDEPSAAVVALAIAQSVLPKAIWLKERGLPLNWAMEGIPGVLHLDNAPEFHSRALKRGCQQHGIRIHYRPPATPRFGGHIERLMGTLMTRIHALPGSTSSNVVERGDYESEDKAILTLGEFERIFALEVLGPYHNEIHSTLNKTPASAWASGIAENGDGRQPPDPSTFVLDFLPFEERMVRREGIRLFNITYFDGALEQLLDSADRKLRIKYDPRNLGTVFVELPTGGHLRVPYADLGKPPISLWELRAATRAIRETGRQGIDETAIFVAIDEQRRLITGAQARSKAARRASTKQPNGRTVQPVGEFSKAQPDEISIDAKEDEGARVPTVSDNDAWKTEFLA